MQILRMDCERIQYKHLLLIQMALPVYQRISRFRLMP